ncbi:MAG: TIGR00266 family protein [Gemmatimonadota bacterium]|nr:TIGR00266 family protein [Gemmatimonadota bacterium]MDE3128368.1 TIGR00266 family protein [Gemmatimonadota bacterium]MDE3173079.1 TIGR00266 family protein [Gemmatimonadota bacterium]MDE3217000.1 TIGR00266 family protein [Gemmatimonadota bacterium]
MADVIDYKIIGDDLQAVIITLDSGERVIAEAGSMMFMQDGIRMDTTLDPNDTGGGMVGKLLGGAKRALSGDSFFMTTFTNDARPPRQVAFAAVTPGKVHPVELKDWGGRIIAQRDAFLCAARGINVSVAFSKRLGAGFFGGEGFILQRIEGDGQVFLHASGTLYEMTLAGGEKVRVDTGCIVAFDDGVDYDIEMVPGVKTALFGGEGLFFATLTGPGRVVLQSMPFSRLADRIVASAPRLGGQQKGEGGLGSALGLMGGLLNNND